MVVQAAEPVTDRVAELAARGYDVATFLDNAGEAIDRAIPNLGRSWYTLDPASLLITSSYGQGCEVSIEDILRFEYFEDDFNRALDVARNPVGVQTLRQATDGHLRRSSAYRIWMEPIGIEHEAVVALRSPKGQNWGTLGLVRDSGSRDFDREELRFLNSVSPGLADGIRRGLLVGEATDAETPNSPAMVVLDPDWQIESMSPAADRWLSDLPGGWSEHGSLPPAVLSVAARSVAISPAGSVAMVRVRTLGGPWVVLHGVSLSGTQDRRIGVIIEPAAPARLAPLLMSAYGLTPREQDVTRRVLRGDSTAEIASVLFVSKHTVQQHLKAIFEKVGVRSRRELSGRVFFNHYEPRVTDNESRVVRREPIRGGPWGDESDVNRLAGRGAGGRPGSPPPRPP